MRLVGLFLSLLVVLLSTPSLAVNRLGIITPASSFIRPNDTTTYGIGDLVANSTTAANVIPMSWTIVTPPNSGAFIRRANIRKSGVGVVTPNFRLHLFTTVPVSSVGDNVALATTGTAGWFCDLDVNMYTTTPFSDGNSGIGVPNNGAECAVVPSGSTIYGLLEARGAYVPLATETFTVTLEVYGPSVGQTLVAAAPSWVQPGALLDLDFANDRYWYNGQTVSQNAVLTTARASAGNYAQSANGLFSSFAAATARITNLGILMEEVRVNSALWARDMTNAAWVASNMTTAQTATGIDGTANSATTLTASAGNATVLQTITLASAADTYSVWLKRLSGTGNVDITIDNGTTWTTQTLTSSYQLFQVGKTAANPIFGIRLVTSGDSVAADFNQLEGGTFATSPILTTTVAVTRNTDVVQMAIPPVTSGAATIVATILPKAPIAFANTQTVVSLSDDSTNNRIQLARQSGTGALAAVVTAAAVVTHNTSTVGTIAIDTVGKLALAVSADPAGQQGAINGVLDTASTGAVPVNMTALKLNLRPDNLLPLDGYLQRLTLWRDRRLPNDTLRALTQ